MERPAAPDVIAASPNGVRRCRSFPLNPRASCGRRRLASNALCENSTGQSGGGWYLEAVLSD